jgi:6-phosphogluconolactonase
MTMGQTPRNFNLDPGGRFLLVANQSSDSIVQFHVDSATGALTPTDQQFAVAMPVCLVFCSTAFLSAGNKYPYQ